MKGTKYAFDSDGILRGLCVKRSIFFVKQYWYRMAVEVKVTGWQPASSYTILHWTIVLQTIKQ